MEYPGDEEVEVYDEEGGESLVSNDEISPEEEAFMKGFNESAEEESDEQEDEAYLEAFEEDEEK